MKIFTKPWDGPFPVPKPDLKMKLTVFLFVISLFQLQAGTGYAQKTKITLNMQGVTVLEVIEEIETITDFDFLYSEKDLDLSRKVSINARKRRVEEVLAILFKNSGVVYSINEKLIILKPNGEVSKVPKPGVNPRDVQQQFEVNGTITDPEGNPLPGVNIIIKGTNQGTMSNPDGKYSIRVETNDILTFSYVGFKKVELPVNGPDTINIQMEEDVTSLEGVEVNAGYYTVKERERTGNISRITAKDIEKQPVANPLQALQGRMPGVYIQQTTGVPGGGYNIQIRGQNSLRAGGTTGLDGNLPLYIVDGVPITSTPLGSPIGGAIVGAGNPLNSINPSDIESIEILKDADATAIYGSRGANGVVLITTKKGGIGKTKVDINFYQGLGKASNKMDLLNTEQYMEMRREAFANDGMEPRASDHDLNGNWTDPTRFTDWQDELLGGTAYVTNVQTTFSGGTQQTQFLVGMGYYRESTVFSGDSKYDKFSTNFNMNHSSENKKFTINFSGNYVVEDNNLPPIDPTSTALTLPPNAPALFDEAGNLNWENGNFDNPLAGFRQEFNSRTNNLIANAILSYQILDGFQIKTSLGYTETRLNEKYKVPLISIDPFGTSNTGAVSVGNNHTNNWIIEPQLTYELSIGSGRLNILIGGTFQKSNLIVERFTGQGYTSDALLDNLRAAPVVSVNNIDNVEYKYTAVFGRVNYNWKEKYILNLTGRRDGSSRFGPGKQFGNFGALGGAWIFSKENFTQDNLPFLSFGKLRMSYGTTGSDQIGDYGYFELWNPIQYPYNGITGLSPSNLFNPDFGWEINRKFEVGFEMGFIDDRIFLSSSYYRNRSDNQLVGIPLPSTTGFSSIQANFPAEVENTGLEFGLITNNIKTKDFSWSTTFNLTIPRSKLIAFPDIENSAFNSHYKVGEPLGVLFAYHYMGVNTETGLYTFEDVNEDGLIRLADDGQFQKEIGLEYFGGFQNNLTYKGFQLDIFLQFVKQTGRNYLNYFGNPGSFSNQPVNVQNRWQQSGDHTDIQQYTQTGAARSAYLNVQRSDYRIGDASFVRLKNVSLSYQFPPTLLKKLKLADLRVYVQGQNLLTFTNYKGLDPETQSSSLPPLRMLTLGIQVTF
ncbi:TonB-dependent receptor [Sinomicrobium oceani]|uniref:TonB-dependent receptor n=1 Tax=Sinomicrobium oceani TaxID=1150368 RepID=UPI00227B651A|nr:TonB-dependent receptor [Sinomicrobium oceani]